MRTRLSAAALATVEHLLRRNRGVESDSCRGVQTIEPSFDLGPVELRIQHKLRQGVADGEGTRDFDSAHRCHGQQGRSLHLDAQHALGLVVARLGDRFAVRGIDRPRDSASDVQVPLCEPARSLAVSPGEGVASLSGGR